MVGEIQDIRSEGKKRREQVGVGSQRALEFLVWAYFILHKESWNFFFF